MKPLWMSNAPWAGTGYGQQTRLILKALKEMGHEPECFPFWGLQGGRIVYDGYPCWPPSPFDDYGNDVILGHVKNSKVDSVITLMDLFVLNADVWSKLTVPWIAWLPIDCEDVDFPTTQILDKVDFKIAMSNFGAKELEKAGHPVDAVIYHAVDTEVFKPMDKQACRAELGFDEDCYLIGMVMANKGDRKQYPQQFRAIRDWVDKHPHGDNVKIFLHTETTNAMSGWDMKSLVAKNGFKGQVYSTDRYFATVVPVEQDMMAKMYNAMDVLLNVSAGEGFGIPIVEAQSCGVPVITHGVTAMPEITINGYCVEPVNKFLSGHFGYQFHPDVDDIVTKLEAVYRMSDKERSVAGRKWVVENCSLPVIAAQWDALLHSVANRETEFIESKYAEMEIPVLDDEALERLGQNGNGQRSVASISS